MPLDEIGNYMLSIAILLYGAKTYLQQCSKLTREDLNEPTLQSDALRAEPRHNNVVMLIDSAVVSFEGIGFTKRSGIP